MNAAPSLDALIQTITSAAAAAHHRGVVVFSGDTAWCREQAYRVISTSAECCCWIGEQADSSLKTIAVENAHTLLGGEWHRLVYDAHCGFDANAFGAVAGTVKAGGLLLLLTPPLDSWRDFPDPQRSRITVYPYDASQVGGRFLQRLAGLLAESSDCLLLEQGKPLPQLPATQPQQVQPVSPGGECATAEQQTAVESLCRVVQGHRRRPLVLVSDRGRGKTTALGLAAARLLKSGTRRIVVTAPRLSAVAQLFQHAAASLPEAEPSRGSLILPDGAELLFEPPDRLVHETIPCDLLLVDEAAAIPSSLLERMLRQHSRIAFATTVHGYEGTGRGFDLRFHKVLDEVTPGWRRIQLTQPIRWAEGDPLERLVFRALLLDAEPADDASVATVSMDTCRIERLDRDALATDDELLSQLFGLLVLAHYRTAPADLRNLLDGPNLEVVVLRHQQQILATALLAAEGGFDRALSRQVYEGKRRLRGNLLPQSLTVHAGIERAACLQGTRVMRIAVHPARQGEGLGSRLIEGVAEMVRERGNDYLGASFGATPELLDFWRKQQCLPVRVGLKREASSGMHAAMVIRPLSPAGESLLVEAREHFQRQLPIQLSEPLSDLEAELVERLLEAEGSSTTPTLDATQWADVSSFAFARRDYGNCLAALHTLLLGALADRRLCEDLSSRQRALLIAKILQRQPWQILVREQGYTGREEAMKELRHAFAQLCHYYGKAA